MLTVDLLCDPRRKLRSCRDDAPRRREELCQSDDQLPHQRHSGEQRSTMTGRYFQSRSMRISMPGVQPLSSPLMRQSSVLRSQESSRVGMLLPAQPLGTPAPRSWDNRSFS